MLKFYFKIVKITSMKYLIISMFLISIVFGLGDQNNGVTTEQNKNELLRNIQKDLKYRGYKEGLASFFYNNEKYFLLFSKKDKKFIDKEISIITESLSKKLSNYFTIKVEAVEREVANISLDERALNQGLAENPDYTKENLAPFYTNVTYSYKKIKKNRTIQLFGLDNNNKYSDDVILRTLQPEWEDIVKKYGYSKLGALGLSKNDIKKFRLIEAIYKVEFLENKKCIFYTKHFGDNYGFEFYNKIKGDSSFFEGNYTIKKIDLDNIIFKKNPLIFLEYKNKSFDVDYYDIQSSYFIKPKIKSKIDISRKQVDAITGQYTGMVEYKIKKEMDEEFDNYHRIIDNMFYDFIGVKLERMQFEAENQRKEEEEKALIKENEKIADAAKLENVLDAFLANWENRELEKIFRLHSNLNETSINNDGNGINLSIQRLIPRVKYKNCNALTQPFQGSKYLNIGLYKNGEMVAKTNIKFGLFYKWRLFLDKYIGIGFSPKNVIFRNLKQNSSYELYITDHIVMPHALSESKYSSNPFIDAFFGDISTKKRVAKGASWIRKNRKRHGDRPDPYPLYTTISLAKYNLDVKDKDLVLNFKKRDLIDYSTYFFDFYDKIYKTSWHDYYYEILETARKKNIIFDTDLNDIENFNDIIIIASKNKRRNPLY